MPTLDGIRWSVERHHGKNELRDNNVRGRYHRDAPNGIDGSTGV